MRLSLVIASIFLFVGPKPKAIQQTETFSREVIQIY